MDSKVVFICWLTITLSIPVCQEHRAESQRQKDATNVSSAEIEIYLVILGGETFTKKDKIFLVDPKIDTYWPQRIDRPSDYDNFAFIDYVNKNKAKQIINPLFLKNKNISLMENTDFPINWERFRKKYPEAHGFFSLSRTGFNQKKDKAIVSIGEHSGPLNGRGVLFLLEKLSGAWRVVRRITIWES